MIDKLQMFIALARERHFGRAAESCGVTQPSLSLAIRQLEEQLGVQLVHRGSRFQGLTPEGQHVLNRAIKIVGDVRVLREEMRAVHTGLSGQLRLGVIPSALPLVARLTRPFLARHKEVTLSVYSRNSAEILAGIEALELDAGITYLDNEPLGRVVHVPVAYEEYCLIEKAQDPDQTAAAPITWAEAASRPLCLLTPDMQNRRIIDERLGTRATARLESNSTIVLVSHVASGQWASIVSRQLADLFTRSGEVIARPLIAPQIQHLLGVIAAKGDMQTPLLSAFLDEAQRLNSPKS